MRTMAMMQTHCKMRIIFIIHIIYIYEKADYKLSFKSIAFPRLYSLYIWKAKNIGKQFTKTKLLSLQKKSH